MESHGGFPGSLVCIYIILVDMEHPKKLRSIGQNLRNRSVLQKSYVMSFRCRCAADPGCILHKSQTRKNKVATTDHGLDSRRMLLVNCLNRHVVLKSNYG